MAGCKQAQNGPPDYVPYNRVIVYASDRTRLYLSYADPVDGVVRDSTVVNDGQALGAYPVVRDDDAEFVRVECEELGWGMVRRRE